MFCNTAAKRVCCAFYHPCSNLFNLICCETGLIWVVKRATSLFNSFCSNVAKQVARFLSPVFPNLKRQAIKIPASKCDSYTRMMQMMQMNLPADWPKTGLARDSQTRTRFVDSPILYHVFARKQCILCSSLRHKSYLTLLFVTLIQESFNLRSGDSFCLGTFAHGFIRLLPFARLLVGNNI